MNSLWIIPLELKNNHSFCAEFVEMNLLLVLVICVTCYSAPLSLDLMIILEMQGLASNNNGIQKTWFIISYSHKIFAGIHSEFFITMHSVGYKLHVIFSLTQVFGSYGPYKFLIYIKFTASHSEYRLAVCCEQVAHSWRLFLFVCCKACLPHFCCCLENIQTI